jgi:phage baseplate assembly protein W
MAISFKNVGFTSQDRRFNKKTSLLPIGVKTPLSLASADNDGLFEMHYEPSTQIHDNLRNLILTNNGERLGRFTYGADLRSLNFDYSASEDFEQAAALRIQTAVENSMPFVELEELEVRGVDKDQSKNVTIPPGMAMVEITLKYNIPKIKIIGKLLQVVLYVGG